MIHSTKVLLALGFISVNFTALSSNAIASTPHDVDLSILDKLVKPCDEFYQYACGGWLAKTEIPADRPMWNRSFSTIDLNNQKILNKILKGYASGQTTPANPDSQLLGDFYESCMNENHIEKTALIEIQENFSQIDTLTQINGLAALLARLHNEGVNALFSFGQEQDAKNSNLVIGVADQGGLGLPDRDYYLSTDSKKVEIRKLYAQHILKMLQLAGQKNTEIAPASILKIETALAEASLSRVDRRDPKNLYHRLERKGLIDRVPAFRWNEYLEKLNPNTTSNLHAINLAVPDFFIGLNSLLENTPITDLKLYLKWHLLMSYVEALPKQFVNERFNFTSKALSGQKKLETRWKRCVRAANSHIGFALGRSFIKETYGEEGKLKSQKMIAEIENQFKKDLESLTWMDSKTKQEALQKLSKIKNKIGYPKVWRSYDGLKITRNSFLKNLQNSNDFESQYELNKIGKPVDPNEWYMTPSTVNAYYDPQKNEIVFPAGILQYPFFNKESSDSLNYGAIGVVMGHELTHGFDDQGRQYDSEGNLKDWWDEKVLKKFEEKTACVVDQYSQFEALPGIHVNGKLTLGENIADQGGMKIAYQAWKIRPRPQPQAKSITPEQKFFIAFAQSWCQKENETFTRMRATIDPHSPSRFRVNGVISQFEPFAKAFNCPINSKMAPTLHCEVW